MLPRARILEDCGHEANRRSFAIDVYRRVTDASEPGANGDGSLFATAFVDSSTAEEVYYSVIKTLNTQRPIPEDIIVLPPLDMVCSDTGVVSFEGILMLVLSKTHGTIVPVCSLQAPSADLLDALIDLYEIASSTIVTMNNIMEVLSSHL